MRVLAIDHGSARAGCAVSDPTGTIARPLGVVEPPDPRAVAELAAENQAELVIVGLPVSLSGAEGPQAAEARAFRDALAVILDVPVETYDERLTTRMAERSARAGASAPPDALAAAHLLESYLAGSGGRGMTGAERPDPFDEDEAARERERRRAEREARRLKNADRGQESREALGGRVKDLLTRDAPPAAAAASGVTAAAAARPPNSPKDGYWRRRLPRRGRPGGGDRGRRR